MGSLTEDPAFLATTFVVIDFETTTPAGRPAITRVMPARCHRRDMSRPARDAPCRYDNGQPGGPGVPGCPGSRYADGFLACAGPRPKTDAGRSETVIHLEWSVLNPC